MSQRKTPVIREPRNYNIYTIGSTNQVGSPFSFQNLANGVCTVESTLAYRIGNARVHSQASPRFTVQNVYLTLCPVQPRPTLEPILEMLPVKATWIVPSLARAARVGTSIQFGRLHKVPCPIFPIRHRRVLFRSNPTPTAAESTGKRERE